MGDAYSSHTYVCQVSIEHVCPIEDASLLNWLQEIQVMQDAQYNQGDLLPQMRQLEDDTRMPVTDWLWFGDHGKVVIVPPSADLQWPRLPQEHDALFPVLLVPQCHRRQSLKRRTCRLQSTVNYEFPSGQEFSQEARPPAGAFTPSFPHICNGR